ncbi:MAG: DUF3052 family protein [Gemmatimonadota bacterium]
MGAEAKTTLTLGRQTYAGTALLETTELIFRGDTRLRIPLTAISDLAVKNGALHVTHAEGVAILGLGDVMASKWADKIRNPRTLADKLGITQGMTVALLDVDDAGILADLEARSAVVTVGKVPKGTAMVLWRITRPTQLSKLTAMVKSIARDGAIWVIHPRGDASVADTVIFTAAKAAGLTYTKVVRVSETDTAEKLVIPVASR